MSNVLTAAPCDQSDAPVPSVRPTVTCQRPGIFGVWICRPTVAEALGASGGRRVAAGAEVMSVPASSRSSQIIATESDPLTAQVFEPAFVTVIVTRTRESVSPSTAARGTPYRALAGGSTTAP